MVKVVVGVRGPLNILTHYSVPISTASVNSIERCKVEYKPSDSIEMLAYQEIITLTSAEVRRGLESLCVESLTSAGPKLRESWTAPALDGSRFTFTPKRKIQTVLKTTPTDRAWIRVHVKENRSIAWCLLPLQLSSHALWLAPSQQASGRGIMLAGSWSVVSRVRRRGMWRSLT
ncbi:hypothetical protein PVAG01_00202 [Phlyctema vagabunda]|uniref:Uncharacterized protein n=1 Tax=Phlyctema vagabunda TaxID=108571 RepID=A0ABR4PTJ3_9HELO